MNYLKIYNSIIDNSIKCNRKKNKIVYYEYHHIIPKCHGGNNLKSNIAILTAKEHFICHKLLIKIYPTDIKLALAFHSMVYTNKEKRQLKLSARDFEQARIYSSISSSGINSASYGKKYTAEHRYKISKAHIGIQTTLGMKLSDETKLKISIANKGKTKGIPKSQAMRDKLSKTNTGRKGPTTGMKLFKIRKPISAINPNGIIELFDSATEMNEKYNLTMCNINSCLKGRQKSTNGWTKFEYR